MNYMSKSLSVPSFKIPAVKSITKSSLSQSRTARIYKNTRVYILYKVCNEV